MAIKISACVIVKNEAKNMPRWLECMKNVADEIIVVDTGSTDNTVELARNAGAKLYHFEWIKDFAAAKNYALDQATGDWILFLDADETFTPAAQKVLRQELEQFNKDKSVACLLCRMLDIDTDDGDRLFNTSLLPRIFRCSPYIRYAGAIHEQLENSQGNKRMIFAKKLEILHTGYSSSIIRSKTERNLPMLLHELKNATTDKERRRLYPYLMDAYNTFGDYDNVLYYGQKCIDNGYSMVGDPAHFYETIAMTMYNVGKPVEEIMAKLNEAEEKFPEEPFFPFLRGMVLEKEGDDTGAELAVLKGLELRKPLEKQIEMGVGASDTSRGFLPYAYERLGNIYSRREDTKKAAENYYLSLKHHKYLSGALRGLYNTLSDADDIEIIELLNTIYNREKDGRFILRSLKGYGRAKVMAYYGKNVTGFESGYAYMAQGRYDSGAVKLGQYYKELIQLATFSAYNSTNSIKDGFLDTLVSKGYRENLLGSKKGEADILHRLNNYRLRNKLDSISFPAESVPLVSIMIPTYNRPELFERTLMSAINQTYPNVEILVNDNSTNDDTQILMEKYVGIANLKYFRNKEAKNKAENFAPFEQQAQGQYLQWCMDDDLLVADKLGKMVPILRDNAKITLVSSVRGIIDENDELLDSPLKKDLPIPEGEYYGLFYGEDMARQMLMSTQNLIGEPSATLFRHSDLIHHYWQAEAKGYKTISDVAMWCELLEKGHCVIFKDSLSYYRRHGQQEGQRAEIILLSRLEWMQLITEYYEKKVFLKSAGEYREALMSLYNEYEKKLSKNIYVQQAENYSAYRDAMELITKLV